jgi:hypothetical protein
MQEKELLEKDVPWGYSLCFNDDCANIDKCMHYQARLMMSKERYSGNAIYPTAWQDGECKCFSEKKLIEKAWGFKGLYKNVPRYLVAEARRRVRGYFGNGMSVYYRMNSGDNTLSPKQQEDIMKIISEFGSTEDVKFDHYITMWNFD